MTDDFSAARQLRKRQQKWWREHIPLAYLVAGSVFLAIYLIATFGFRSLPKLLSAIGMTPSGVNFVFGVICCALGISGLRNQRIKGSIWVVLFALCLFAGILTLLKAFALV
jgi:hypothetical protein